MTMERRADLRRLALRQQPPVRDRGKGRDGLSLFLARMKSLMEPHDVALKEGLDVHVPREVAADHLNKKLAGRPTIFDLRQ